MGSDNLHHRRKAEKARPRGQRQEKLRFLIVCEGTKTEPNYLTDLRNDLRIHHNLVVIANNNGNSPSSIVEHAKKIYDEESSVDRFDHVFCVFDRDQHADFDSALQRIKKLNDEPEPKPFSAITSSPCFEFWLLLHFAYSSAPFNKAGRKSAADQAIAELRRQPAFKDYSKGQKDLFSLLKGRLDVAKSNALNLRREMAENGGEQSNANPWTNFDVLMNAIKKLAN